MAGLRDECEAYRQRYGILAAHAPEFVAVRSGLKTAVQITVGAQRLGERERSRLEAIANEAGLMCTFYVRHGLEKVLIAREALRLPDEDEDENVDNRFSYPVCCVRAFESTKGEYYMQGGLRRLLLRAERVDGRLNPFAVATPFHLTTHLPCSLGCTASLAYAERLLELLRERTPALAAGVERWCRRPALYTDVGGIGVLFDGTASGARVGYRAIDYVGEPLQLLQQSRHNEPADVGRFAALVGALRSGDEAELDGATLFIRKSGVEAGRHVAPPHLTWRLLRFD